MIQGNPKLHFPKIDFHNRNRQFYLPHLFFWQCLRYESVQSALDWHSKSKIHINSLSYSQQTNRDKKRSISGVFLIACLLQLTWIFFVAKWNGLRIFCSQSSGGIIENRRPISCHTASVWITLNICPHFLVMIVNIAKQSTICNVAARILVFYKVLLRIAK